MSKHLRAESPVFAVEYQTSNCFQDVAFQPSHKKLSLTTNDKFKINTSVTTELKLSVACPKSFYYISISTQLSVASNSDYGEIKVST